jgi:hypothetical protein
MTTTFNITLDLEFEMDESQLDGFTDQYAIDLQPETNEHGDINQAARMRNLDLIQAHIISHILDAIANGPCGAFWTVRATSE